MHETVNRIREALRARGAALAEPADIRELPADMRGEFTHALLIGVALDPEIIEGILGGPSWDYCEEYRRANRLLFILADTAADMLKEAGYSADPVEPTTQGFDKMSLRARFSHKAAATRAGVGWIGKNDLLITREYGSALRFAAVLTDADLGSPEPVNRSFCGSCTACLDICPGKAPSGKLWEAGMDRDEFFNVRACYEVAKGFSEENGFGASICGMCIAACPWTKRYIEGSPRVRVHAG
jgi:epoxyqueuosine reductase